MQPTHYIEYKHMIIKQMRPPHMHRPCMLVFACTCGHVCVHVCACVCVCAFECALACVCVCLCLCVCLCVCLSRHEVCFHTEALTIAWGKLPPVAMLD